jgi:hypothetical protein
VDNVSHVKESMPHDTGGRTPRQSLPHIVEPLRALKGIITVVKIVRRSRRIAKLYGRDSQGNCGHA